MLFWSQEKKNQLKKVSNFRNNIMSLMFSQSSFRSRTLRRLIEYEWTFILFALCQDYTYEYKMNSIPKVTMTQYRYTLLCLSVSNVS